MTPAGAAEGGGGGGGAGGLYSVRAGRHGRAPTLNICDAELVGTVIEDEGEGGVGGSGAARRMPIKAAYYGDKTVGRDEAARMISGARIANIVGRRAVGLAIDAGLGSDRGVKTIGGVPFLIVFR